MTSKISPGQVVIEEKLSVEFQFLENLILYQLSKYFPSNEEVPKPEVPRLEYWHPPLKKFIRRNHLNKKEAILLLICLTPHIHPDLFDRAIEKMLRNSGDFPKIGGIRGKNSRSFLPTGETALFLLAGDDPKKRLAVQKLFWADHLFSKKKILWLEDMPLGEPVLSGKLILSQDYIDTFIFGRPTAPHFSISFPAMKVETELTWDDLVIDKELNQQVQDILDWLKFNKQLMFHYGMHKRLKKGYRTLFYGPPGTGKTFTAGLLGKYAGKDVYKIDLSMVVSKYIGETEKNLELLFARAEDKGWILFFDEADALFGKRTNVRDAHDKYANQEVSYLLQRIEDYDGLIILATNMRNNVDFAFMRRFNSILKFSFPDVEQRAMIWRKSLPHNALFFRRPLNDNKEELEKVNIPEEVKKYEIAGGNIINVIHFAGIKAVERLKELQNTKATVYAEPDHINDHEYTLPVSSLAIYLSDILDGIKREFVKEGKPFVP